LYQFGPEYFFAGAIKTVAINNSDHKLWIT
jgi:hypothetical protein